MDPTPTLDKDLPSISRRQQIMGWISVLVLLYLLIVAVSVISRGFRAAVGDEAEEFSLLPLILFWGLW